MANPTNTKPGFLLIEIMCAFLLLIIAASIMGFYLGLCHKQQKSAQHRFAALLAADAAIEELSSQGHLDVSHDAKCQIKLSQEPRTLEWTDGSFDQIWITHLRIGYAQENIALELVLPQKVL